MPVYFIQAGDGGPIKIGFAIDPKRRLRSLQDGAADGLRLLGTKAGSKKDERLLHQKYKTERIRGEWFCATQSIIDEIEMLYVKPLKREVENSPLAKWRTSNNISRTTFAAEIGVSYDAVRLWELGERIPSPDLMRRIKDHTHDAVTANDFYEAA